MNIRNIAICLIEHQGKIFVAEGVDEVKNETFYRPLGGGIEFGETAQQTVIREFQEEMQTEIEVGSYLTTFENLFTFNGIAGHQIVLLLSAKFKDKQIYQQDNIQCNEEGTSFIAKWVNIEDFLNGKKILYPSGIVEYLKHQAPIHELG
ncbi:NUDIX hydrolase [Catenovulum agarivorans DS-2]|uniref:NUDIX hydrolase n=1 Tax=Catenovulum agarivorans DS-2 TaxID=1328313 RepID=W7QSX2_9ALTE|nr:NUDIX hydrolase [Catenovulum agarivorans]EWH10983.1 NUDIX hydrolase [Catenovulum agarivorans DS-2]